MAEEGYFTSRDGLDFFERRWAPDGEAQAHIVLIHGYGEHCGRYGHVAQAFNEGGLAVHAYDQRGFGRSPGKRAYIRDFDGLLLDLDHFVDHVRPRFGGKPWFLMGHSMGGLVLARYVETRTVDARGLVFSSALLAFGEDVPRFLLPLASVLGTFAPWLPVASVDNTGLSRDPTVVEAADNDPLCFHGRTCARTGAQFQRAIQAACADFEAITAPLYVIHGAEDRIVGNAGSRLLHERCGSEDKTLKIYEGGYHELFNDLEKEAVIAGMRDWMLARIQGGSRRNAPRGASGYAGFAETGTGAHVQSGGLRGKPVSRSATATYPEVSLSAQQWRNPSLEGEESC